MVAVDGVLKPFIETYVSIMHPATVALALLVPLVRLLVKKMMGFGYASSDALHEGISAAALPSLFAMVLCMVQHDILEQINAYEFFAAGLLGIVQTVALLFTHKHHGAQKAVEPGKNFARH